MVGWFFKQSCEIVDRLIWVGYGPAGFFSEVEKLILLNELAVGWLVFQTELRELIHAFGLDMGLLAFPSEVEKLNVLNGLAVG